MRSDSDVGLPKLAEAVLAHVDGVDGAYAGARVDVRACVLLSASVQHTEQAQMKRTVDHVGLAPARPVAEHRDLTHKVLSLRRRALALARERLQITSMHQPLATKLEQNNTNPAAVLGEPDELAKCVVLVLHVVDDRLSVEAVAVQAVSSERAVHVQMRLSSLYPYKMKSVSNCTTSSESTTYQAIALGPFAVLEPTIFQPYLFLSGIMYVRMSHDARLGDRLTCDLKLTSFGAMMIPVPYFSASKVLLNLSRFSCVLSMGKKGMLSSGLPFGPSVDAMNVVLVNPATSRPKKRRRTRRACPSGADRP